MKRRLLAIILILAAVAGAIYYAMAERETAIILTGVVTTDDVIASAQVQGRIERLFVKQGDPVEAGQLLATIQPGQWEADMSYYQSAKRQAAMQVDRSKAELQYQQLQTKNQIAQAQANLAAAEAQVAQAQATLENDRLTFQREEVLYKQKVESQQAYDQARTTYDASQAHVLALRKAVQAAEAALDMAKSNAQQDAARQAALEADTYQLAATEAQREKAQVQLAYTRILAPAAGIVDVRASREGEVVNPGQAIVTLMNPDDLWVRADVEETYIDRIFIGQKLQVGLPSGAQREGKIFYRAVDADYATQRDVSRTKRDIKTFEIRLRCDNKDRALAVGMTAYVTLTLDNQSRQPSGASSQPTPHLDR